MRRRAKDRFSELLQSNEFAGHIIRWVSIFEGSLDNLLSAYFANRKHVADFYQLVLPRLSFAEKIDILRNIKLKRPLRSQQNIVASLDRLRRLRNALAHNMHLPEDEFRRLRSDKWTVDFVSGYPKSIGREKNALENRFSLLWKHFFKAANR